MTGRIISIRGLGLSYERDGSRNDALRGFDLEVPRGELLAIVGPSGVGKSTLLRVLKGSSKPSDGTVVIRLTEGAENAAALVSQDARLLRCYASGLHVAAAARHLRGRAPKRASAGSQPGRQ